MTVAGVLWGTIGPAAAIVQEHTSLSPLQTSFWRLLVAILPVAGMAWLAGRGRERPTASALLFGAMVGSFTGASQLAYFAAVDDSGIAIPTLVANGLGPILTALGQTVIFRSRPDSRTLLSLAAALAGLALLVLDGPKDVTGTGLLLSVGSALAYACSTLAAGPASRRMDVTVLNAASIAGGACAMLPFVLLTGGPGLADSAAGWAGLIHLGLVVSGLSYALYYSAARSLPSTHLSILALLDPLVSAVIAIAFFDEALTPGAVVGGALMLCAVAALSHEDEEEPPPIPAAVGE